MECVQSSNAPQDQAWKNSRSRLRPDCKPFTGPLLLRTELTQERGLHGMLSKKHVEETG